MPNSYDVGDKVTLSTVVKDNDGITTAPGSIALSIRSPDNETATVTVENDGVGLYHYDLDIDQAGTWAYRWTTTGNAKASDERVFFVRSRLVS